MAKKPKEAGWYCLYIHLDQGEGGWVKDLSARTLDEVLGKVAGMWNHYAASLQAVRIAHLDEGSRNLQVIGSIREAGGKLGFFRDGDVRTIPCPEPVRKPVSLGLPRTGFAGSYGPNDKNSGPISGDTNPKGG